MPTKPLTPNFRKVADGAMVGEKLVPIVRAFLWNPDIPAFTISLPDMKPRKPDGWFHPSTHPLMDERELYYYLLNPDDLVSEPLDPHGTMAITQGHFWHELIGQVLGLAGVLITHDSEGAKRVIESGGIPVQGDGGSQSGVEWHFRHVPTQSRGNVDGLLEGEVYEFKTIDERIAAKFPRTAVDSIELVDAYRDRKPEYYAQAQEYMRITGYRRHRTLLLSLAYPFPMREIVMTYNEDYALGTAYKYERVLEAIDRDRDPDPCCSIGSSRAKSCFARQVCPIGVAS